MRAPQTEKRDWKVSTAEGFATAYDCRTSMEARIQVRQAYEVRTYAAWPADDVAALSAGRSTLRYEYLDGLSYGLGACLQTA